MSKSNNNRFRKLVAAGVCAGTIVVAGALSFGQVANPTCPLTSPVTSFTGTTLTTECATSTSTNCTVKAGTVASGTVVQLAGAGGNFQTTSISTVASVAFAATGDFNKDGWTDFVGAPVGTANSFLSIFLNQTWQNEGCTTSACSTYSPAPTWTTAITPKFINSGNLHTAPNSTTDKGWFSLGGGDFNGDGWDDVFEMYAGQNGTGSMAGAGWYNRMSLYLNKAANNASGSTPACTGSPVGGCAQFHNAYNANSSSLPASLAMNGASVSMPWLSTNIQVVDWNKDGHLDVLIGHGANGGTIQIFTSTCTEVFPAVINNGLRKCSSDPMFTNGGVLLANINTHGATNITDAFQTTTTGSVPVFSYTDFDNDGLRDLVVGGINCCDNNTYRLRLYKGCPAASSTCSAMLLETTASQYLRGTASGTPYPGGASAIMVADYTLDGKPDIVVANDGKKYPHPSGAASGGNPVAGGRAFMWANTGTSAPYSQNGSGNTTYATELAVPSTLTSKDYDVGFWFDYDKDPQGTPDLMIADGNDSGQYYVFANRVQNTYVSCGDVTGYVDASSTLSGSNADAVVSSARMTPSFSTNGGTVTFYMSNEDPANWITANLCPTSTTDYCVTFPKPSNQIVRWKATLCSNTNQTVTPTISGVTMKFDYTKASEHYRAGVVVNDGVAYLGAFRQPGDRGKFYAVNAGFTSTSSTTYFEFGSKLDAMADTSRNIYTSVNGTKLAFTTANAASSSAFRSLLQASDATAAQDLVTWVRSKRFGYGTTSSPATSLGAVVTSSPAILTKPGLPSWYLFATSTDRSYVDAFVAANASRQNLVLFGSKDGMVHALYTTPTNTSDPLNGTEAWAYIPPTIAPSFNANRTAQLAANAAATDGLNHPIATAYPDGSPTLLDYFNGSTGSTVALVAEGNGGRSFSVIDVTSSTSAGPTPMWTGTPGDSDAGYAFTKPTVARVKIGSATKFVAIVGTGMDTGNDALGTSRGRVVTGYDLADGTVLWQFQTKCSVTSDITAFETDDALDGTPALDGYIDRVVFADYCGNLYKLNPAVNLAGGWLTNTGMGAVNVGNNPGGTPSFALFSTATTTGALGADRAIAGTIGARIDSSTRMILYFGTGGIETVDPSLTNHFYAVYADNGDVRSKYVGTCSGGYCEKFYGGVVVTPTQVILTRTIDAAIAVNTCDDGSSVIQAYQANANGLGNFVSDFEQTVSSAIIGSLFADQQAVYFATLSGDISRVGDAVYASAGAATTAGGGQGTGEGQNGMTTTTGSGGLTMVGWRVVL